MPLEETTIFEDKDIKITSLRAIFGSQIYDIADITAVTRKIVHPLGVPAVLAAFALFMIIGALVGDSADNIPVKTALIAMGLFLFLVAFVTVFPDPSHEVHISTASGDVKAFSSFDKSYVDKIVAALKNAVN